MLFPQSVVACLQNETLPPPVQPKVDESNEVDESDLVPNVDEGTAKVGVATADQQLLAKNTQVDETEVKLCSIKVIAFLYCCNYILHTTHAEDSRGQIALKIS